MSEAKMLERQIIRMKIKWYKQASNEKILFCINDKPICGYAVFHQAIDKPFAIREAKKRGIL